MITTAPVVTEAGKEILAKAMSGEHIIFTRFEIGSGIIPEGTEPKNMTSLVEKVWVETGEETLNGGIGINEMERGSNFIMIKGTFDNAQVSTSFKWRELGIFCKAEDGVEHLYAYSNDSEKSGYVTTDADVQIIEDIVITIAVGDAENVTSEITGAGVYASKTEFIEHTQNRSNPHHVTKADVGLGKLLNLTIEEQAPVYKETDVQDYQIESGEMVHSVLQKLKTALKNLNEHVNDDDIHSGGGAGETLRPYTKEEIDAFFAQ